MANSYNVNRIRLPVDYNVGQVGHLKESSREGDCISSEALQAYLNLPPTQEVYVTQLSCYKLAFDINLPARNSYGIFVHSEKHPCDGRRRFHRVTRRRPYLQTIPKLQGKPEIV